jgi:hypothetical protein
MLRSDDYSICMLLPRGETTYSRALRLQRGKTSQHDFWGSEHDCVCAAHMPRLHLQGMSCHVAGILRGSGDWFFVGATIDYRA